MRLNKYTTRLDDNKLTILVKESSCNYNAVDSLSSASKVFRMMNDAFYASLQAEEYVWVIALNTKCRPVGIFEISHGTVNMSVVEPREVFIRLCLCGAVSFIMVHNHPSGDVCPSDSDDKLTSRMKEAGKMMRIEMLDHIIIGQNYYSYQESAKWDRV